jgi:hypothetical protein
MTTRKMKKKGGFYTVSKRASNPARVFNQMVTSLRDDADGDVTITEELEGLKESLQDADEYGWPQDKQTKRDLMDFLTDARDHVQMIKWEAESYERRIRKVLAHVRTAKAKV